MNQKLIAPFIAMLITLMVSISSVAQVTTSGIRGRITDTAHEPMPGVVVTAKHDPSGTIYRGITNADGYYNISGMRPGGPYTIEATFLGFEKATLNDVRLALGDAVNFDIILHDSSVTLGEVTVVGERGSKFNSTRTGAATNFNLKKIETMPTVNRSLFDVAQLTPQAVSQGGGSSFAGASNKFNSFQIDGTVNNDVFGLSSSGTNGGTSGASPISIDAIQELQVVIAPFDVRQSGFTGAGINAVTKSGTNTFHGSAYGYYQNENFWGKTPGKDVKERKKLDKQSTNTYGFTFGGPIIKDKLFFFTNAEVKKETYPTSYDIDNGSNFTKEEADKVVNKIKELTNGEYDAGGYAPKDINTNALNLLARLDWNINDDHKLTARYSFIKGRRLNFGRGRSSLRLGDNGYYMNSSSHSLVTELNSRFGNDMSNEFRFGYTRVRDFREVMGRPFPYIRIEMGKTGNVELGTERYSPANELDQDIFTISDNLSIYRGAHTITVGTHNEIFVMRNLFIRENFGSYVYSSLDNFLSIGTPNEAMPKDYNYSYANVEGNPRWAPKFNAAQIGFYAQDEWEINPQLRLTYGLRIDMPIFTSTPSENTKFNSLAVAKEYNVATDKMPKANPLWSPRVGFRWHANEDRSTLLRGGAGIFTGRVPFVWISNAFSNSGVEYVRTRVRGKDFDGLNFKFNPDPAKQYVPQGSLPTEIDVLADDFKFPQVLRLNLAWEQRLPYDIKFTLEGLYSKTLNNILVKNLAIEKIGTLNAPYGDNRNVYATRKDIGSDYTSIIYLGNTNKGYAYNISGKLEKDFDFGLSTMIAYTYSDSRGINDGTSSQAYSNWSYNETYNGDAEPEVTLTDFNVNHRVIASIGYSKQWHKNFGTTVNLFYNGQSGRNYSFVYNGDINGDGVYGNDVAWIPNDEQLAKMNFVADKNIKLTPDEMRAAYGKWINDHSDIADYKGTYIPRNALKAPFEHHFDLFLAQDFHFDVAGVKNTIQLNYSILNVGNLLNPAWGIEHNVGYNYNPVGYKGDGKFTFDVPRNPDLIDISNINSRWHAQIGLKYIF